MSDPGDTLRFKSNLYDNDGVTLVNATSVVLTITLPDGTTASPSVTNPPASTGVYYYDYAPSMTGRFVASWLFTLAGGATTSFVESKDARQSLVTVGEALSHLRAAGVITLEPDLEQLQQLTFYATDAVERDLGRVVVKRTVTETYDGGRAAIPLQSTPVVSVASVVESGVTLTAGDYILRKTGWLLQRGTTTRATSWAYGWENVSVAYVAGYNDPPLCVRYAALGILQGMWQESQQSFHPGVEMDGLSGIALAAPSNTVSELQRAYNSLRAPGFA